MSTTGIIDGDEIFEHVRTLVELGPRRTGTEGGRAAAEYVAASLRAAGVTDVSIEEAPSVRWEVNDCSLVIGGAALDAFPVAHSGYVEGVLGPFGTGPEGITGRIVDLDAPGDPADLEGAIALFDVRFQSIDLAEPFGGVVPSEVLEGTKFGEVYDALDGRFTDPYHTTLHERVVEAVRGGAVGFVAVLADYFDSNHYVNEDYGDLTIPGAWVTKRQGAEIRERIAQAGDTPVRLVHQGSVEPVKGLSPVGVLPGRSAETILVHSHHDSAFGGAVQDASGTALVLALAKHFASIPHERRARTLMFATMDTHFTGYESHQAFVENHVQRRQGGRELLVDVTIEHIARAATVEDGQLVVGDTPSPRLVLTNTGADVIQAIERATDHLSHLVVVPTSVLPGDELPTDAHFTYEADVSVISLISAPIYLYDECDTPDMVDRAQLAPVARAFADLVDELSSMTRDQLIAR